MTPPSDVPIPFPEEWRIENTGSSEAGLTVSKAEKGDLSLEVLESEVTQLYIRYASSLQGFAYCLCSNLEIAREAVQETFLRYHASRLNGQMKHGGKAWLFRTARNYVLDRAKESFVTKSVCLEEANGQSDYSQDPSGDYEQSQLSEKILKVLSPREKECLQLRAEGFKYREIATLVGIDPGTVGAILARGLDKVRKVTGRRGQK